MREPRSHFEWPDGRRFAFSIFDDTDHTTLANGPVVYRALTEMGFRITKSVWVHDGHAGGTTGGSSCDDPHYVDWVRELRSQGHELALHNVADGSSTREQTVAGLDRFRELFGADPRLGADHAGNRECLYGGAARLSGWRSAAYAAAERVLQPRRPRFSGHDPASGYFWGDVCRDRIDYWRGLAFAETDVSRLLPAMPYRDPLRPSVRRWFITSDAPTCADAVRLLDEDALDRLEDGGGWCIVSTHLGLDFVDAAGRLDPRFESAMRSLSRRDGWFVPVTKILDHLASRQAREVITVGERRRLERRWIADRLRHRVRLGPSVVTTPDEADEVS